MSVLLCGCQAMMGNSPQLQTIGELLEDNGQDPKRLGIERNTDVVQLEQADGEAPVALGYYDHILDLDAAPGVRFEAMRRAADLRVQAADSGDDPEGGQLARAVAIYQQLLREFPDYSNPPQILYQLARAYQLQGNDEAAIGTLRRLAYKYPRSKRASDALFRAAEMQFIRGRYADAANDYHRIISLGGTSPYWQVAQYKYGWCRYQLRQFEQAIPAFVTLLSALLPDKASDNLDELLHEVSTENRELVRDSLRGLGLSFAAAEGGVDVGAYFAANGEPAFYPLVYRNLALLLLEKRRYTDAASVYESFGGRHPQHDLAEPYAALAIAALEQGGFVRSGVEAKERYVERYAIGSEYWRDRQPSFDLSIRLRRYMGDIAGHYHALAQRAAESQQVIKQQYFLLAASWYARILTGFPAAEDSPDLNLLYADALFDGGKTQQAADQYSVTAYGYEHYQKAPEAALAVIKAYRRLAAEVSADQHRAVLEQAIAASQKLIEHFPAHPEKNRVLLAAAEDLFAMDRFDESIAIAEPLLRQSGSLDPVLRRKVLSIVADSQFALQRYSQAEALYARLLQELRPSEPLYALASERLAVAIYRQAETTRDNGELQLAAKMFLRVAKLSPDSTLQANAYFDAGSLWYQLKDWPASAAALESLRKRFPSHALNADVDKLLADAYEQDGKLALAARSYGRIASRGSESQDTRRSAGLLSARLYDKAGLPVEAAAAYRAYLNNFPAPLLEAQQARRRLADLAGDTRTGQQWLRQIIAADDKAGSHASDSSHQLAAQASLELALADVVSAKAISLSHPLAKSLPRRKRATEIAIASLGRAVGYGYVNITTAATHELGGVYQSLAQALLSSERPKGLRGEALEQYEILLEEEVFPFEEKAIAAFETNVRRVEQGLWNEGIRKSLLALAGLVPAKYGKQAIVEESYDSLY